MAHNNRIIPCFTRQDYEEANFQIVENTDGTVSVFDPQGQLILLCHAFECLLA